MKTNLLKSVLSIILALSLICCIEIPKDKHRDQRPACDLKSVLEIQ